MSRHLHSASRESSSYIWDTQYPLGQGATSMVFRGRSKRDGEEVAVKVFTQAGHMRPADVQMREYDVMRKLKHQNIVSLLDIEEEIGTHNQVIVMELSYSGTLFNMLEEPQNAYGLEESEYFLVLAHVAAGMKHLRDNDIVHRDIKPGNILKYVAEDGTSVYKLTDFGAARELQEEEQFMSLYGTEEYLHPDMYERAVLRTPARKQFGVTVDLWSLGVTFFHVATGHLPFRPFGGRRNRDKMHEITTQKASGIISGIQRSDKGPVEWSRELPPTCRLSLGARKLVTPFLAGLLESDADKVWQFEKFFTQAKNITIKTVIHIFCPTSSTCWRIYTNKENRMSHLQELIAEQSEIPSGDQLLIFEGHQLCDLVDHLSPVSNYPKSISEQSPIFVYSRTLDEVSKFPPVNLPEYPRMSMTVVPDVDCSQVKQCCAVTNYIMMDTEHCHLRSELLRHSVRDFVSYVYRRYQHLDDYLGQLRLHCSTARQWLQNFAQMGRHTLTLLGCLSADTAKLATEMEQITADLMNNCFELSSQVESMLSKVGSKLDRLAESQLKRRQLQKEWKDDIGCQQRDRCKERIEVHFQSMVRIMILFKEDKRKRNMSMIEEQFHKHGKSKLTVLCTKAKSLYMGYCVDQSERQFQEFSKWYRRAHTCFIESEQLNLQLSELADKQTEFVRKLAKLSSQYCQSMEEKLSRIGNLSGNNASLDGFKAQANNHWNKPRPEVLNQINHRLKLSEDALQSLMKDSNLNREMLTQLAMLVDKDANMDRLDGLHPSQYG
ncbi:hypothetical protein ScPMuIL_008763 [Solemya velum]